MAAPEINKKPTGGITEIHDGVTFIIQQPIEEIVQNEIPEVEIDAPLMVDDTDITVEDMQKTVKKYIDSMPDGNPTEEEIEQARKIFEDTFNYYLNLKGLEFEPTSQFGNG